jgi:enoyl-CoA hydratase/carnithine racemase
VVGKSLAMKMCLTGEPIDAKKALECGLVAEIYPPDQLVQETIKMAEKIAANSPLMVGMAKQAVNRSYETSLEEGPKEQQHIFYLHFLANC